MKFIPLDAVLAEIESLLDKGKYHEEYDCAYRDGNNGALYALKGRINSLEVKGVDLEKEIDNYFDNYKLAKKEECWLNHDQTHIFAEHFFELGVNASNPLTWEDIKLIWTIGDEIPYMPEEDFFKELLKRFKAQKEE